MFSEFSSRLICACYLGLGHVNLDGTNSQMQTHLVPQIMHQKWPYFLRQLYSDKNSFIVLVPEREMFWGKWRGECKQKFSSCSCRMRALQRGKVHLKVQREKTNIRQTREHSLTFLKGHPRPLFVYFWSFIKQTLQILQQINVTKCPSTTCCWDSNSQPSECESPPITTRPGLTYFVMGSITVRLTSYLTGLDSAVLQMFKSTTYLLIWPNPNQSNRRSAIQPYPKEVSIVWTCSWCYKTFLEEI